MRGGRAGSPPAAGGDGGPAPLAPHPLTAPAPGDPSPVRGFPVESSGRPVPLQPRPG